MGKKLPSKKSSVSVKSRRPSRELLIVSSASVDSPIQEEYDVNGDSPTAPKSRRSSRELLIVSSASVAQPHSPIQEECGVNGDSPTAPGFSQALHDIPIEENGLNIYKLQPTVKVPHPHQDEDSKPKKEGSEEDLGESSLSRGAERRWAYQNVVGIGLSFTFVFSAFIGLQNLQSSINSSGGLGLASLAIIYVFFAMSGFITPSVIKIMGTKYTLLAGFMSHLFYTLANFYPSWYTLIPTSVLLGIGSALIWAAGNSHIVKVAVLVAPKLAKDQDHLISIFTGIFFFLFEVSQVPGNLASSLILFPYNGTDSNEDSNGTSECHHSAVSGHKFDVKFLYILGSVYALFVMVGIFFLLVLVNHLGTDSKFFSTRRKWEVFFKLPLIELLKVMKDYKMVLIAPISVFGGLEQSFAFGTFTEVLISDCFGTYQVGFTLISLGVTSAIMSVVCGKIVKCIPRALIFIFGGLINIVCIVFLFLWSPVPSYVAIFLFATFWGTADGIWNTMTTSLTGILFPTQSNTAYSAQRIWLAVGFTIGFLIAEFLSLNGRLWLMLAAVLLALSSNVVIELIHSKLRHKLFCYSVSSASGGNAVKGVRGDEDTAL